MKRILIMAMVVFFSMSFVSVVSAGECTYSVSHCKTKECLNEASRAGRACNKARIAKIKADRKNTQLGEQKNSSSTSIDDDSRRGRNFRERKDDD